MPIARSGVVVIVGHHEIPPVEAVLAAVGNDVAGKPFAVFTGHREEVAASATVDADDGRFGGEHGSSVPETPPARGEPRSLPG